MISPRIKVYLTDVTPLYDDKAFMKLYDTVSPRRREKTDLFRFRKDKCLSLGAEYLFMQACEDFGIEYKNASISYGDKSKPYFTDIPVYYNLSHSGSRAMCIMSDLPVGCDVEQVKEADTRIADRFFSPVEYSLISDQPSPYEKNEMFYRLWTLKESYIKCIGTGLSLPLDSFSVVFRENGIDIEQESGDGSFVLFEHDMKDGYRYAWCVRNDKEGDDACGFELCWKKL